MGRLVQPGRTQAHPVRRARSAWRLVPVALGTAAALAGCGAGGHNAPPVASGSVHEHPAASHRVSRAAASPSHKHAAASHRASRAGASSTHKHRPISQTATAGPVAAPASAGVAPGNVVPGAGATNGTVPGASVTVGHSSAKRSGADAQTPTPRPGATIKVITGTQNATIGTLAERTSVLLAWTASEGPIQIFTSQGNLLLSSRAHNGSIRLAPGTYDGLHVASPGAWSLRLHAAA